jgi:hypothetical protein
MEMPDAATIAVISASIAAGALVVNVLRDIFNGGWNMSQRLATIEASVKLMEDTLDKMGSTLQIMADMRTEHALLDQKVTFLMEDINHLRKGQGYIQAPHATTVDGMYPRPKEEGGR